MFLHGELQVQAACALLPLREHVRRDRRRIKHLVFLVLVLSFFSLKFCQSSPVFGELRPLVHFDGELLMVSFVVSLIRNDVYFRGRGWGGRDCYAGGSYHWFTG